MALNNVNLRLGLGGPDGPRSTKWRVFSNKEGIYISHGGLGGVQKFSFHKSLVCRHAFTEQEGPAEGDDDRVLSKWRRVSAPANGIVYALVARFPSDFLSTALTAENKAFTWLPAAATGHATVVEFVFSGLSEQEVNALAQASGRTVVSYTKLPNNEAFVVTWVHESWEGKPFTVPGAFDRNDQLVISKHDPLHTGRPVRFTIFIAPTGDPAPTVR